MTRALSLVVVVAAALYLVGLAVAAILVPARATRFLSAFAGSARAHYLELLTRLVVGGALLAAAPQMWSSRFFVFLGWVLAGTTVCLLLVPWQWHRRFARWAVPQATRHPGLIALGSFALGVFLLAGVLLGAG